MTDKLTGSLWIRALLTVGVLGFLASRIDLAASLQAIVRLDAGAAAMVLLLLAVDRAVMVWRWIVLLRATGTVVATKSAVWIYLVSSFVGSFLPAGVGGDAARAYALSRRTAQGSEAVASVAVDRLLGLLSIIVMGIVGLAAADRTLLDDRTALVWLAGAAAAGVAAFLWADRWARSTLPDGWHTSPIGVRVLRLADALGRYRGHRGALVMVFVLSVGVQVLRILQAWLLGRGIGIEVPLSYYLLFMPVGLIALMLPISLSGFGAPQGVIVWLLRPAGVPEPDSFALSTLIVLSGLLGNLPGAVLYLRSRRERPAARNG